MAYVQHNNVIAIDGIKHEIRVTPNSHECSFLIGKPVHPRKFANILEQAFETNSETCGCAGIIRGNTGIIRGNIGHDLGDFGQSSRSITNNHPR